VTNLARWSIDFRIVNIEDATKWRGAECGDSFCTGTSLHDFRRMRDFAPMPDEIVATHDEAIAPDGVKVFAPF
jgi:hypothetical protein